MSFQEDCVEVAVTVDVESGDEAAAYGHKSEE